MATNKHALIRYQILDKCFRNPGRKFFIKDLIAYCNRSLREHYGSDYNISLRQIYADIKDMETQYEMDLVRTKYGKQVAYRYKDTRFSINNKSMSAQEESELKEVLITMRRIKGLPHFEWMEEMVTRLDAGLNQSNSAHPVIHFDQNVDVEGLLHMQTLYHAITRQHNLQITQQSFSQGKINEFIISPYFLKQFKGRWYLFGQILETGKLHDFPLDRILKLAESDTEFVSSLINFDDYFEDVIGVNKDDGQEAICIKIRIDAAYYPFISTKPLHGSQKVLSKNEQDVFIQIEVVQNYELQSLLLSYGDLLEVIEPAGFRAVMAKRIKRMMGAYNL